MIDVKLYIALGTPLRELERDMILGTLDYFDGNKIETARALQISLKTLYNKLNRYTGQQLRREKAMGL